MKRIRDLMTVLPRAVKVGDSIVDAAKVMRGEDAGIAPIVDGDRLVGVITDRDIAIRVVAAGRDPERRRRSRTSRRATLVTVDPDQDLDEALRLMAEHEVRRLPVVEEDGRLVGIVAEARGGPSRRASPHRRSRRTDFAVKSGLFRVRAPCTGVRTRRTLRLPPGAARK